MKSIAGNFLPLNWSLDRKDALPSPECNAKIDICKRELRLTISSIIHYCFLPFRPINIQKWIHLDCYTNYQNLLTS